jgi:hypothetical protein
MESTSRHLTACPRMPALDRGVLVSGVTGTPHATEHRFNRYLMAWFHTQLSDCSAIHLTALASLEKPSIVSTCPVGHVASTIQPIAGGVFLRAVKVGRGSVISHRLKNFLRNRSLIVTLRVPLEFSHFSQCVVFFDRSGSGG